MAVLVPARMYTVSTVITNPGAVTNLNIQASATRPVAVVRVKIDLAQATIPTSGRPSVARIIASSQPGSASASLLSSAIHSPRADAMPWFRSRLPAVPTEAARWLGIKAGGWAMQMMDRVS